MIVTETQDFWLLNKPPGESINDNHGEQGFITRFKREHHVDAAHPVHRLDKETSGLLLVAKHAVANRELSMAFQLGEVEKHYIAITRYRQGSKAKKKQGWVRGDMKPARNGDWKLCPTQSNPAITHFTSWPLTERRRLCLLKPQTGKTHQLRVAMKSLSMPIVGDLRYGGEADDRMYLHALGVKFSLFGDLHRYTLWPDNGFRFMADDLNTVKAQVLDSIDRPQKATS